MNRTGKLIFIIVGVLLLGLIIFAWLQPKEHYYWGEDLGEHSEEPYGLEIFYNLLDDAATGGFEVLDKPLYREFDPESRGTYVGMGHSMFWSDRDFDTLLSFVGRGNQAFICVSSMPEALDSLLFEQRLTQKQIEPVVINPDLQEHKDSVELVLDSVINATNTQPDFTVRDSVIYLQLTEGIYKSTVALPFAVADSTQNFFWDYIPMDSLANPNSTDILGVFNENNVNFIRVRYGKGEILLHLTPMAFTNYPIRRKEMYNYVNGVLEFMVNDKIYWDSYNRYFHYQYSTSGTRFSEGPLSFILSQPALKWAWTILLLLTLLFLVFNLKRVQRIIPLADKNENTSLEYVKTIGELYYRQRDHKSMAEKEMELFLYNVRKVYHLQTLNLDDTFVKLLADRSGVDKHTINEIVNKGKAIDYLDEVSDQMYLAFQNALMVYYAMEELRSKRTKKK